MSMKRVYEVTRIINKLDDMRGEEGEWGLADVCAWSNLSRATINRGLNEAQQLGFLIVRRVPYKGKSARRWKANWYTPKGLNDLGF